jgi:hypothetical protein
MKPPFGVVHQTRRAGSHTNPPGAPKKKSCLSPVTVRVVLFVSVMLLSKK